MIDIIIPNWFAITVLILIALATVYHATRLFIVIHRTRRNIRILAAEEDQRWLRDRIIRDKDIDPEDFYLQRIGLEKKKDVPVNSVPYNLWS